MKKKTGDERERDVRKVADPDTDEGLQTLARYIIATCVLDAMPRERQVLAGFIAATYFGSVSNAFSDWYPDEPSFARIEAIAL